MLEEWPPNPRTVRNISGGLWSLVLVLAVIRTLPSLTLRVRTDAIEAEVLVSHHFTSRNSPNPKRERGKCKYDGSNGASRLLTLQ